MTEKRKSWDEYFIGMARYVATRSKDRSTKVGVVLVGEGHTVLGTGYNGMCRQINEKIESRYDRPLKYLYWEHGERNTLYNMARNGVKTLGATMYIASCPEGLPPCADCARAIIQCGIARLVYMKAMCPDRWKESCDAAMEMLKESGVEVVIMEDGVE